VRHSSAEAERALWRLDSHRVRLEALLQWECSKTIKSGRRPTKAPVNGFVTLRVTEKDSTGESKRCSKPAQLVSSSTIASSDICSIPMLASVQYPSDSRTTDGAMPIS